MSHTKQKYRLGKIKQLIDLNGDSTNFDLQFQVTCEDDTPFKVLVVDQTTLDNNPDIEYKETKNTISGHIVADKNVYQNYFLILKSDTPCNVEVELTKKVLPKTPELPPTVPEQQYKIANPVVQSEPINWKKIAIISALIVGAVGIIWFLYRRNNNKEQDIDENPFHNFKGVTKEDVSSKPASPTNAPLTDISFKPRMQYGTPNSPSDISSNSSSNHGNGKINVRENADGGVGGIVGGGGNTLLDRLKNFSRPQ